MKYDYIQALTQDVNNYIDKKYANDIYFVGAIIKDTIHKLSEDLWCKDSVTGNGTHGYCTRDEALSYLDGNMSLLEVAGCEFEADWKKVALDPIYADCLIRCYLLDSVIHDICIKRFNNLIKN